MDYIKENLDNRHIFHIYPEKAARIEKKEKNYTNIPFIWFYESD